MIIIVVLVVYLVWSPLFKFLAFSAISWLVETWTLSTPLPTVINNYGYWLHQTPSNRTSCPNNIINLYSNSAIFGNLSSQESTWSCFGKQEHLRYLRYQTVFPKVEEAIVRVLRDAGYRYRWVPISLERRGVCSQHVCRGSPCPLQSISSVFLEPVRVLCWLLRSSGFESTQARTPRTSETYNECDDKENHHPSRVCRM